MRSLPRPRVNGRRLALAAAIMSAAVAIFAAVAITLGLKYPNHRKRVLLRAGTTWLRVEDAAQAAARRVVRRRDKVRAAARRLAHELLDGRDELPVATNRLKVPRLGLSLYSHGAYMGAGPAMLASRRWRKILAFLMPDVYYDVAYHVGRGAGADRLIPMFENNPVVCAFGTLEAFRSEEHAWDPERPHAVEWDVFLSTDLVQAWEKAPEGPSRQAALAHLVDRMVIAHASTTDTVQEQLGMCQWADVRKTRKAGLGGLEPEAWMDLFARALHLAQAPDLREAIERMRVEPRWEDGEECRIHTFRQAIPTLDAVERYRQLTQRRHFSVVLELKSIRGTANLITHLVEELNRRGIHVAGVGSFQLEEIRGVHRRAQVLGEEVLPGPLELLFTHFAGDLMDACDAGKVPPGQCALFNGACLLTVRALSRTRMAYGVDEPRLNELARYREQYGLRLGVYVQENDLDGQAAALLADLVQRHPATLELGLAWGGLPDEVAIPSGVGDHRGFGSQRLLFRLGVGARRGKRSA